MKIKNRFLLEETPQIYRLFCGGGTVRYSSMPEETQWWRFGSRWHLQASYKNYLATTGRQLLKTSAVA